MPERTKNKIIHVAQIIKNGGSRVHLLLLQTSPHDFEWFEEVDGQEIQTPVKGANPQEAIKNARKFWKRDYSFRTIACGRRYTLPERDEHGENALFHQMASSLRTMNGIYFDDELGHSCIVQDISLEGRQLFEKYQKMKRL